MTWIFKECHVILLHDLEQMQSIMLWLFETAVFEFYMTSQITFPLSAVIAHGTRKHLDINIMPRRLVLFQIVLVFRAEVANLAKEELHTDIMPTRHVPFQIAVVG